MTIRYCFSISVSNLVLHLSAIVLQLNSLLLFSPYPFQFYIDLYSIYQSILHSDFSQVASGIFSVLATLKIQLDNSLL